MLSIYFCLKDATPVLRYWPSVPRIGETVALPELGGNLDPLRVYDVIWEGFEEPSVSVYVHRAKVDHPLGYEGNRHLEHPGSLRRVMPSRHPLGAD